MNPSQQILLKNFKMLQNVNEIGAALAILSDPGSSRGALARKYEISNIEL